MRSEPRRIQQGTMQPMSPDEANQLWEQYRSGGNPAAVEAIDRLYRALRCPLMEFCKLKGCDPELADEITEQAFFRLMRLKPPAIKGFISLLHKTAQNLCSDTRRSAVLVHGHGPTSLEGEEPSLSAERTEAIQAVRDCLSRLQSQERAYIISVDIHRLTQKAACQLIGWRIAPATSHKRYHQIRTKLARCLKEKNIF